MINKQSLWFVTLFSLIIVLSVYYFTIEDKTSLDAIISNYNEESVSNMDVKTSIDNLNDEKEKMVSEEINNINNILIDKNTSNEDKNNAYLKLNNIKSNQSLEEKIANTIKEQFGLYSSVSITDKVVITVLSGDHNTNMANNIIKCAKDILDKKMYITVKFTV